MSYYTYKPTLRIEVDKKEDQKDWPLIEPTIIKNSIATKTLVKKVPETEVRFMYDDKNLYARFDCYIESLSRLNEAQTPNLPIESIEHICLEVSTHCSDKSYLFRGDFKGQTKSSLTHKPLGEIYLEGVPDTWNLPEIGVPTQLWNAYHGYHRNKWWTEFEIPWTVFGYLEQPSTLFLNVIRNFATANHLEPLGSSSWSCDLSNQNLRERHYNRLIEASLYSNVPHLQEISFSMPYFNQNKATLSLKSLNRSDLDLQIATLDVDRNVIPGSESKTALYIENVFNYKLYRDQISHLDLSKTQTLRIQFVDQEKKIIYHKEFPFDRHKGICICENFEGECNHPINTQSKDTWLESINKRLPQFTRTNTNEGAPSDFTIIAKERELSINLMENDAWQALANVIENAFDATEDKLIAAMSLIGQKEITNLILEPMFFHASGKHSYHSSNHELMGPLSVIRYGGGNALARASALAKLLQCIINPETSQPFNTRVISLTKEGGPVQTKRSYSKATSIANFVQAPGRIGMVAVEYQNSLTLLDPTTLSFFPKKNKLACLEEVLSNDGLLREGAGLLAPAIKKISIEEVKRQPCNVLHSQGVFPEQCANEDGQNSKPEDKLISRCPAISLGETFKQTKCTIGNHSYRDISMSAEQTNQELIVKIKIKGIEFNSLNNMDKIMERVHLAIDVKRDHRLYYHFISNLEQTKESYLEEYTSIQTLYKNIASENVIELQRYDSKHWHVKSDSNKEGYSVTFKIPLTFFNLKELPPIVGIQVWVDYRFPFYGQVALNHPRFRMISDPMNFIELYTKKQPIKIKSIDFGAAKWYQNDGTVTIYNTSSNTLNLLLETKNKLQQRRNIHHFNPISFELAPREEKSIDFKYFLSPEEKFPSQKGQQLIFTLRSTEEVFYQSHWHIDFSISPAVHQRFGSELGTVDNPKSLDDDFLRKKVDYICSKIPLFKKKTTLDGAESDFILEAEDSSIIFNLMHQNVLTKIGKYIYNLYDNNFDRILGFLYLSQHPGFVRHMSSSHRFIKNLDPLSLIRANFSGGGGNCAYTANCFAGLISHMKIGDQFLPAHVASVWKHNPGQIELDGKKIILDTSTGDFLLHKDKKSFFTIEDMMNSDDWVSTMSPGSAARYVANHKRNVRSSIRNDSFAGIFPSGAPQAFQENI